MSESYSLYLPEEQIRYTLGRLDKRESVLRCKLCALKLVIGVCNCPKRKECHCSRFTVFRAITRHIAHHFYEADSCFVITLVDYLASTEERKVELIYQFILLSYNRNFADYLELLDEY